MKSSTWILIFAISVLLLQISCNKASRHERNVRELLDIEREFAGESVVKGSQRAFLAYIDDSCVLLRANRSPVIGRQKIEEMFGTPDTSFTLNWDPLYADVSESGDMGYTYGIFKIEMDSPEGTLVTKEGTYATIWKKDRNGKWKFVLDTGNQGLGKKNGEKK
jgi:ketosteroid isomerase-like protein